ncbi:MAG: DUF4910 domain-containing protein [Acidobacteriota bacterium]
MKFVIPTLSVSLFTATMVYPGPLSKSPPLLDRQTMELLQDELSGELAKDHVIAITRHHRVQGSRGYSDAARYVLEKLHGFGFTDQEAWIETFESDGRVEYQTWQSPSGWSIESAELRMVEPYEELMVRYPETPMSVITYSNPGHIEAQLVDVGKGTSDADYEGKEVKGKLVLATGYGGAVHRLAVLKYGAAAVVCYLDDDRAAEHPDMLQYTGMWPRSEELPEVTFGFNITNRQGRKLKGLLAQGKSVVLDARVDGIGLEAGKMDVVVALLSGSGESQKELLFTAHLDHPKESANDNASGSSAILDIARTFKTLIGAGTLPHPRQMIRFLWVPEFFGTMAYVDAHPELKGPERGGRVLANLNLDMVGENLELLHSRLNITWTPESISSALTDVVAEMVRYVDRVDSSRPGGGRSNFNYRLTPFSGGSDHVVFNDGAIGVPAMMLGHWPDYTHHTTEDTPDKVDPVELERSELIAASTFWYLATLTEQQSLELVNLVAAKAQARLADDTHRAAARLVSVPSEQLEASYHDAKAIVDFALNRELRALESVLHFAAFDETSQLVEIWRQSLEGETELQRRTLNAIFYYRANRFPIPKILGGEERIASRWVPARLTRGPLSDRLPELRLPETDRAWYASPEARSLDTYLLVNLIDGKRSILDIRNDLSAATLPVSLQAVDHLVRDLAKVGLVELKEIQ